MATSFNIVYSRLEPHIVTFETKRKILKSKGTRNGGITAGIILATGLLFLPSLGNLFWIIAVIALIIGGAIANAQSKELTEFYKKEIVPLILDSVLPGAHYEPEMGISEDTFRSCKLFPHRIVIQLKTSSQDG